MNQGGFNKLIYDQCAYEQQTHVSTEPFAYQVNMDKYENKKKCVHDKFWYKYDLVDIESELRNQTRQISKCSNMKYNTTCKINAPCLSTYSSSVPVVLPADCCPIVQNNIKKTTDTGIKLPTENLGETNTWLSWITSKII